MRRGFVLSGRERWALHKLLNEYYSKVKRQLKNKVVFEVHIKVHEKEGKRKKFNVHVDVDSAKRFGATADDWDLARAVHKVMKNIMSEIEHKLHISEQYERIRR